jgi:hypothetical protein
MRNVARLGLALTLVLSCFAAACADEESLPGPAPGSGPGTKPQDPDGKGKIDSTPSATSGLGVLRFLPEKSYSGFDGVHTFKAPFAVYDSGDDLVVSPADPSALDVAPVKLKDGAEKDAGKYFMVTVKKAGVHTVVAKSGGKKVEIALTATAYDPAQWLAGEQRYQAAGATGDPPCVQCHRGGEAIDHSPAALSTATDKTVANVITSGRSTFGAPIKINGQPGHKWTVADPERQALVVYLRGLSPAGFQ